MKAPTYYVRKQLLLRLSTVIFLAGFNGFIALPFWQWWSNPEASFFSAMISFAIAFGFFFVPYYDTDERGHAGWSKSLPETLFSFFYSAAGIAILPAMYVNGDLDIGRLSQFLIISVLLSIFLAILARFWNPSNNGKKSTT